MEHRLLSLAGVNAVSTQVVSVRQKPARTGLLGDESGLTLLEILVVVGLMGALAGMAIMVSPSMARHARADAGLSQLTDAIRGAREIAISQRRNVRVVFGFDDVQILRVEIGVNGVQTGVETVLRTVELEGGMEFRVDPDVNVDTPDGFAIGCSLPLCFGGATRWMFTSEGTFVNQDGDVINGTAFLSIPGQANSARAITIMGATALIHAWSWNGRDWVE